MIVVMIGALEEKYTIDKRKRKKEQGDQAFLNIPNVQRRFYRSNLNDFKYLYKL